MGATEGSSGKKTPERAGEVKTKEKQARGSRQGTLAGSYCPLRKRKKNVFDRSPGKGKKRDWRPFFSFRDFGGTR